MSGVVVPELRWKMHAFDALPPSTLYAILALRSRVFVVEQTCVFQDPDGKDQASLHLSGEGSDGNLVAYARILPPGLAYAESSIGRVIVAPEARGAGLAHGLMARAIAETETAFAGPIRIGAQHRLERFYATCGFVTDSEPYDEDGILHVEMMRPRGK